VSQWHGRDDAEFSEMQSFLYDSPVPSLEFGYRERSGNLLAVGICDRCPDALSSVYFYFDPEHRARGLGTYGALCELEYARENAIAFYYLGFWVRDCAAMK